VFIQCFLLRNQLSFSESIPQLFLMHSLVRKQFSYLLSFSYENCHGIVPGISYNGCGGGKEVKDYLWVPVLAVGVKLGTNPGRKKCCVEHFHNENLPC